MAAKKKSPTSSERGEGEFPVSASVEDLLLAAMERGDESLETGRYVITFREDTADEGVKALSERGLRVADAREFTDQAVALEEVGDAEALVFPEIRSAFRAHCGAGS